MPRNDPDECMCDFESRRFFGCTDESHAAPCPFTGLPDAPSAVEVEAARAGSATAELADDFLTRMSN